MKKFGPEHADRGLGRRAFVAASDAAHRRFDPGIDEALGVLDGTEFGNPCRNDQPVTTSGPAFVQGLLQCAEGEAAPAGDGSRKRFCASLRRTIPAPFSAYISP